MSVRSAKIGVGLVIVCLQAAFSQVLPPVSFSGSVTYSADNAPSAVAAGDFNGDGKPDLAIANSGSNDVSVLLGNGDGTFQGAVNYAAGGGPAAVTVGDFNGDGKLDLAVANSDGTVSVLLGGGDGTFQPAVNYGVGSVPAGLAVGDFNGDGKPDLVVANAGPVPSVTVLLGKGDGTFQAAVNYAAGTSYESLAWCAVAVGDFNGDGKTDLAVANGDASSAGSVSVLLGNGDGTFQAGVSYSTGVQSGAIAVGDFNGDGRADIAVANSGDNSVSVLLSNSDGTFQAAVNYTAGSGPNSVTVADFNGDGKLDLAVTNGDGSASVLVGSGDGAFQAAVSYPAATQPVSAAVSDFNGDGEPDLAVADQASGVSILLNATVPLAATSTVLVSSVNPSVTGQAVTLTATVTSGQGVAEGTVSFNDGGAALGGQALSNGVAALVTSSLGAGLHSLTATYSGGGAFAASASSAVNQVVEQVQTITFAPLSNQVYGTAPFTVSATASSGLTVAFTSTTSSVCAVSSVTVTLLAAGTCTVQATQAGDANYAAASPVMQSFQVTQASQTISFGTLQNQVYGASPLVVSASASSSLPVTFASTTLAVCSVSGATVTMAAGGTCTIQATQSGNANYAAAAPVSQSFQVTPASQAITFGTLPNQPYGTAVALNATASSGLSVTFVSTTPAVCTVLAVAVTSVTLGSCSIQASQAGNASYAAAAPVNQSFQFTQAGQSISFATLPTQPYGTAVTLNASATSGLAVSYTSSTHPVCTVSGAVVTLVALGSCTLQATQAGNADYAAAAPVSQTFQVVQGSQSITFAPLSNQQYGAAAFTISAAASSGLAVHFASLATGVCKVSGATVTVSAIGTCSIQATQAGNTRYAAATPVSQTFLVTADSQTITFAPLANQIIGAPPFTVSATASSGLTVHFSAETAPVCKVSGTTVTLLAVGTCEIEATQTGSAHYAAATPVDQSFQVVSQTPAGWALAGYDLTDSRWASGETVLNNQNAGGLTVKWQFTTKDDVSATPAVDAAGGYVYFPDFSGNLYKLNAATGAPVWTHNMTDYGLGATVMSRTTPTLYGSMVIMGASAPLTSPTPSGAYLLAANASDGSLIWSTPLDPNPNSVSAGSPIVYNGVAYVGVSSREEQVASPTFRGSFAAISLSDGHIIWQTYLAPAGYTGVAVWSGMPTIDTQRSQIYVTTGNNYEVPDSVYACENANKGNSKAISACQAADNYDDSVIALDLATGKVKWAHKCSTDDAWVNACQEKPPGCPAPAGMDLDFGAGANLFTANINGVATQLVGAGQKSGVYWALEPTSGAKQWSTTVGPSGLLGGIEWGTAADNQRIYVAIANSKQTTYKLQPSGVSWSGGSWAALDPATGAILWQVADPGFSTAVAGQHAMDTGPVTVANGVLYAGSMSGFMYALDAATGATLWSFQAPGSVNSGPAVVDGTVYWGTGYHNFIINIGTASNRFYAFSVPPSNAERK